MNEDNDTNRQPEDSPTTAADLLADLPPAPGRSARLKHKPVFLVALVLILAGLGVGGYFAWQAYGSSSGQSDDGDAVADVESPQSLTIVGTGDMIAHDAINLRAETEDGYDYLQMMKGMRPYFEAADVRFCNQAVLGGGSEFGISGYPVFNSPTEFARDMAAVGCNVINTGTNHTNDKEQEVIDASVAAWDDLNGVLAVAGANRSEEELQAVSYFELHSVKFAFVSYTTYSNVPNRSEYSLTTFQEDLVARQLSEAREQADIVMVSMRWGTEYADEINVEQTNQSQFLADQGADIVFGHGPHVLQPVEKLSGQDGRDTYVWYSLGNFLNSQLETETLTSIFAVLEVDIDTKSITEIGYLPVYMHYEWTEEQKVNDEFLARDNFAMFLLEEAQEPLSRSLLGTTVEEQQARIEEVLNRYQEVPLMTKDQYLGGD